MGRLSPSSGQMAMPSRTSSSEDRVIFTFRAREGKSKQLCVVSCMSKRESGVTKAWKDQIGTRLLTVENLLMLKCKMFPLNSKDLKLESNCLSWPLGWKEIGCPAGYSPCTWLCGGWRGRANPHMYLESINLICSICVCYSRKATWLCVFWFVFSFFKKS